MSITLASTAGYPHVGTQGRVRLTSLPVENGSGSAITGAYQDTENDARANLGVQRAVEAGACGDSLHVG